MKERRVHPLIAGQGERRTRPAERPGAQLGKMRQMVGMAVVAQFGDKVLVAVEVRLHPPGEPAAVVRDPGGLTHLGQLGPQHLCRLSQRLPVDGQRPALHHGIAHMRRGTRSLQQSHDLRPCLPLLHGVLRQTQRDPQRSAAEAVDRGVVGAVLQQQLHQPRSRRTDGRVQRSVSAIVDRVGRRTVVEQEGVERRGHAAVVGERPAGGGTAGAVQPGAVLDEQRQHLHGTLRPGRRCGVVQGHGPHCGGDTVAVDGVHLRAALQQRPYHLKGGQRVVGAVRGLHCPVQWGGALLVVRRDIRPVGDQRTNQCGTLGGVTATIRRDSSKKGFAHAFTHGEDSWTAY